MPAVQDACKPCYLQRCCLMILSQTIDKIEAASLGKRLSPSIQVMQKEELCLPAGKNCQVLAGVPGHETPGA